MTDIQDTLEEESNLVLHARTELKALGEDPETIDGYIKVVQAFAEMGHSGGSASVAVPVLVALLQFKNLRPLTDNPEEWHFHGPEFWDGTNGIWQNKRDGEAFSNDGGKTYYLLSEGGRDKNDDNVMHTSEDHTGCFHVWNEWTQEVPVLMAADGWIRQCTKCESIESKEGEQPE